jgi:hypothetical protein
MSKYHDASKNGAAYVYVRSTFGKITGLFTCFIQYCYLPFSLCFQIVACIRGNFSSAFIGDGSKVVQD